MSRTSGLMRPLYVVLALPTFVGGLVNLGFYVFGAHLGLSLVVFFFNMATTAFILWLGVDERRQV